MPTNNSIVDAYPLFTASSLAVASLSTLSATAIAMQEIYRLVQEVSVCKSECKALVRYATSVVETVNTCRNTVQESHMALAVSSMEGIIFGMRKDIGLWRNYSLAMAILKHANIKSRLEFYRSSLNKVLITVR
ncbi:hypothetical protein FRB96_003866, partial [Tulasnella sp. 330]